MEKNVFGYLVVTSNSLNKSETIAADYWFSTAAMKKENTNNKTNYSCYIVCINCSWWFRKKLAKLTGIPIKKFHNVKHLRAPQNHYDGFDIIVTADSMVDDTFYGNTKVYDCETNIPRSDINSCIEIIYEN